MRSMTLGAVLLATRGTLSAGEARGTVLLEAEMFERCGARVDDSQFMDQMGSPFPLAHGLGVQVADATTTVRLPESGAYRLWVGTCDWGAPWKAPGAQGRFQVLIDGVPPTAVFGTEGSGTARCRTPSPFRSTTPRTTRSS